MSSRKRRRTAISCSTRTCSRSRRLRVWFRCSAAPLSGQPAEPGADSVFEQLRVRMRVGRRAAAKQYQRLSLVCPQLVRDARWYDDAVPGANWALFLAESHPAASVGEQVDLLASVVQVGNGRAAGRYDSLGQALVARVSCRNAGQLPDRGAVCRDEGVALLSAHDVHRDKANGAPGGPSGP